MQLKINKTKGSINKQGLFVLSIIMLFFTFSQAHAFRFTDYWATPNPFSPNADGFDDTTYIWFTISDNVDGIRINITKPGQTPGNGTGADGVTYRTVTLGAQSKGRILYRWDGKGNITSPSTGPFTTLASGVYDVHLRRMVGGTPDNATKVVFTVQIDLDRPTLYSIADCRPSPMEAGSCQAFLSNCGIKVISSESPVVVLAKIFDAQNRLLKTVPGTGGGGGSGSSPVIFTKSPADTLNPPTVGYLPYTPGPYWNVITGNWRLVCTGLNSFDLEFKGSYSFNISLTYPTDFPYKVYFDHYGNPDEGCLIIEIGTPFVSRSQGFFVLDQFTWTTTASAPSWSYNWNFTDALGNVMPNGVYHFTVDGQDASGNTTISQVVGELTKNEQIAISNVSVDPSTNFSPNGDGVEDVVTIKFNLATTSRTGLKIVEQTSQRVVAELLNVYTDILYSNRNPQQIIWDGRADRNVTILGKNVLAGQVVPPGNYEFTIHATDDIVSAFAGGVLTVLKGDVYPPTVIQWYPLSGSTVNSFVNNTIWAKVRDVGSAYANDTAGLDLQKTMIRLLGPDKNAVGGGTRTFVNPDTFKITGLTQSLLTVDGTYTIEVTAFDLYGNTTVQQNSFIFDGHSPTITTSSINPPDGARLNNLSSISVSITDPGGTGVNFASDSTYIRLKRIQPTTAVVQGTKSYLGNVLTFSFVPLGTDGSADGIYEISVRARDNAGNLTSIVKTNFYFDTRPPVVDSIKVMDTYNILTTPGINITTPVSYITFYIRDNLSANVDLIGTIISVQGPAGGAITGSSTNNGVNKITYSFPVLSENGKYTLSITPKDKLGNVPVSPTATFFQYGYKPDSTPPTVNATSPANGDIVYRVTYVSAWVTDGLGGIGVDTGNTAIGLLGPNGWVDRDSGRTDVFYITGSNPPVYEFRFTPRYPLTTPGQYTIYVSTVDKNGNILSPPATPKFTIKEFTITIPTPDATPDPFSPNGDEKDETTTLSYSIPTEATTKVSIMRSGNNGVATIPVPADGNIGNGKMSAVITSDSTITENWFVELTGSTSFNVWHDNGKGIFVIDGVGNVGNPYLSSLPVDQSKPRRVVFTLYTGSVAFSMNDTLRFKTYRRGTSVIDFTSQGSGTQEIIWDGKDKYGFAMGEGLYDYRVYVTAPQEFTGTPYAKGDVYLKMDSSPPRVLYFGIENSAKMIDTLQSGEYVNSVTKVWVFIEDIAGPGVPGYSGSGVNYSGSLMELYDPSNKLISGVKTGEAGRLTLSLVTPLEKESPNGKYTLKIKPKDMYGNTASEYTEFYFYFDDEPPVVSSRIPSSNYVITSLSLVKVILSDGRGKGVSPINSSVMLKTPFAPPNDTLKHNSGGALSVKGDTLIFALDSPLPVDGSADGNYTIVVIATDKLGNTTTYSYPLIYDTQIPQILSVTVLPDTNNLATNPSVSIDTLLAIGSKIKVTMRDITSGVNQSGTIIELYDNSGTKVPGDIVPTGLNDVIFILSAPITKEGLCTIKIWPKDNAGNVPPKALPNDYYYYFNYNRDLTPPNVLFSLPREASTIKVKIDSIIVYLRDLKSGVDGTKTTITLYDPDNFTLGGVKVFRRGTLGLPDTIIYRLVPSLPYDVNNPKNGTYTIQVDAVDKLLNRSTKSFKFTLDYDNIPPIAVSTYPAKNDTINATPPLSFVSVTFSDVVNNKAGVGVNLDKCRIDSLKGPVGHILAIDTVYEYSTKTVVYQINPLPTNGTRDGKYTFYFTAVDSNGSSSENIYRSQIASQGEDNREETDGRGEEIINKEQETRNKKQETELQVLPSDYQASFIYDTFGPTIEYVRVGLVYYDTTTNELRNAMRELTEYFTVRVESTIVYFEVKFHDRSPNGFGGTGADLSATAKKLELLVPPDGKKEDTKTSGAKWIQWNVNTFRYYPAQVEEYGALQKPGHYTFSITGVDKAGNEGVGKSYVIDYRADTTPPIIRNSYPPVDQSITVKTPPQNFSIWVELIDNTRIDPNNCSISLFFSDAKNNRIVVPGTVNKSRANGISPDTIEFIPSQPQNMGNGDYSIEVTTFDGVWRTKNPYTIEFKLEVNLSNQITAFYRGTTPLDKYNPSRHTRYPFRVVKAEIEDRSGIGVDLDKSDIRLIAKELPKPNGDLVTVEYYGVVNGIGIKKSTIRHRNGSVDVIYEYPDNLRRYNEGINRVCLEIPLLATYHSQDGEYIIKATPWDKGAIKPGIPDSLSFIFDTTPPDAPLKVIVGNPQTGYYQEIYQNLAQYPVVTVTKSISEIRFILRDNIGGVGPDLSEEGNVGAVVFVTPKDGKIIKEPIYTDGDSSIYLAFQPLVYDGTKDGIGRVIIKPSDRVGNQYAEGYEYIFDYDTGGPMYLGVTPLLSTGKPDTTGGNYSVRPIFNYKPTVRNGMQLSFCVVWGVEGSNIPVIFDKRVGNSPGVDFSSLDSNFKPDNLSINFVEKRPMIIQGKTVYMLFYRVSYTISLNNTINPGQDLEYYVPLRASTSVGATVATTQVDQQFIVRLDNLRPASPYITVGYWKDQDSCSTSFTSTGEAIQKCLSYDDKAMLNIDIAEPDIDTTHIYILRNGVRITRPNVDFMGNNASPFTALVKLLPGENKFEVYGYDKVGNEGEHTVVSVFAATGFRFQAANNITSNLDAVAFVSIPQNKTAKIARLEIYNLSGDLILTIEKPFKGKPFLEFYWRSPDAPCNLCNGDGRQVNNGLYIFKITVEYTNGGKDTKVDMGAVLE